MSNYEEIKKALADNDIKRGILIALGNSLQINITSILKANNNQSSKINTNLNLIQGVKTEVDSQLLEQPEGENLINFHNQQVNSVDRIWQENRETLVKIYQLLTNNLPENEIVEIRKTQQKNDNIEQYSLTREEFENFDLELITDEKITSSETDNPREKADFARMKETKQANWLDEIDNPSAEKINTEASAQVIATNDNFNSELESETFSSQEYLQADTEEEMIPEEVEMTSETLTESWDEMEEDWQDETQEINVAEDNLDNVDMDEEESAPIYSLDDWEEWIDDEDITVNADGTEVEKERQ